MLGIIAIPTVGGWDPGPTQARDAHGTSDPCSTVDLSHNMILLGTSLYWIAIPEFLLCMFVIV